ncbi:MAG: histidinol-phosphate transaminase [Nitrososphaerales archaeon]|nr:histidinol-phosphate transaminase [Nitrososphaerales archaeon]
MNKKSEDWLKSRLGEIKSFTKYVKPKSVVDVALKAGVEPQKVVKLNQNENLFLPKEFLLSLIDEVIGEIDPRVYPKEEETELKDALGRYAGLPSDYVLLGSGSDQLIDLIVRTFLRKEDISISISPTYSMYGWSANHLGVKYLEIPLKGDFSLDVEEILKSSKGRTGICFVCSPNNPTGNQFIEEDVTKLIESFPGLVLLDEAYVEFAEKSLTEFVKDYENLIVTRTFSKAFGLAGLRAGYAIANPEVSNVTSEYAQFPYVLNCIALKLALKVLDNIGKFRESIKGIILEREKLIRRLNGIKGVKAFKSDANFVLFTVTNSYGRVFDEILEKGILLRKIGRVLDLRGCLRTTVGLPYMNDLLIEVLSSIGG